MDRNSRTKHIAFIPMEVVTKTARTTNFHRLKLNISAANERGHHKEEITPIESENKQVEQKWVIWKVKGKWTYVDEALGMCTPLEGWLASR